MRVARMPLGQDANNADDKPVILLGAGGHARVLISLLRLLGRPIAALLDDDPAKQGTRIDGLPITAGLDAISKHNTQEIQLINAIGSAHRPTARQAVYDQYVKLGYSFATLIHPAAAVAPEAIFEQGVQIMAHATLQPGANLQPNTLINTAASIDHDTTIGEHTHIAPGATLCGGVSIGPGCHIGAGATIIQGLTLGAGVVVGAGATVLNDIPNNQTAFGTPAKLALPEHPDTSS